MLVPEFICRELLAAIHAVGADPLLYPVDNLLMPIRFSNQADVDAVVAVNYFGFPQNLAPFRDFCATNGAVLIEDNAHGFLSADDDGRHLGHRGDVGIFSLHKTFAFPDGGALVINRDDWLDRLPEQLPCRGGGLPLSYRIKRLLSRVENTTGLRVRTLTEQVARRLRKLRTGHAIAPSAPSAEYELPEEPAPHCQTLRMLKEIDTGGEVARRRTLYQELHQDIKRLDIEPVFGVLRPGTAPYGYPFRAAPSQAGVVAAIARSKGLDCAHWPDLPHQVASVAPEHYRNVWWVNFLC